MNTPPIQSPSIPGFTVVPKQQLSDAFRGPQSAFYVLLGRHGTPESLRESVLLVDYVDDFVTACQQQIDDLWAKHRVMITHVAVKLAHRMRSPRRDFTETYKRAVAVQELRHKLNPRFRRV